jgi:tyrosyl-tRNA synthetase
VTANDFLTELGWRGVLHGLGATDTLPLDAALKARTIKGYCGFDPTADSLHVGSLLPLMGLVHLQLSGNHPVALIGGGTGLIGDPSGKRTERLLADRDVIEENAAKIQRQIEPFLANGDYTVTNNIEWLGELNLIEFLRDTGKHFSVNVMLQRESVSARMESGISFTEFSYMLLQAYDYLELHDRYGVNLQIGGSDQWGNIAAGVDLIRRVTGYTVHGQTFKLITTASGIKFGKTEAGAVWLDPEKTSPYQFYQFWINVDDRDASQYLRYFTLLDKDEILALEASKEASPEKRAAQRKLAFEVTKLVHGADSAAVVRDISELLFEKGDARGLSPAALKVLEREIPFFEMPMWDDWKVFVTDALVATGLVPSKGAARRLIDQGGVYINNAKRVGPDPDVPLEGQRYLLRKGSRDYALVRVMER